MDRARVAFAELSWDEAGAGVRSKAVVRGGKVLRLVEFTDEFAERDWCTKAHAGYVLGGDLEIVFEDRAEKFTTGDGLVIEAGERHRAKVLGRVARLLLVEEV